MAASDKNKCIFFFFVYCQQEHVRQEISCRNIQFWPGRNSAERITWVVTELPEMALEDLRVTPTAMYHKRMLRPKTFPPSSVAAFPAVRGAAIRMMRRRILKPFSSDAACVARGDNLINFQRGRKRQDVIYKKRERCSIKRRIGEGRTLRNIQLSEQMLNAKAS